MSRIGKIAPCFVGGTGLRPVPAGLWPGGPGAGGLEERRAWTPAATGGDACSTRLLRTAVLAMAQKKGFVEVPPSPRTSILPGISAFFRILPHFSG